MKKTKKRALYIVAALFAALFVLSCLVGFAACGGGDEHVHTWDAGVVTKEADCGNAGETTYTCTECGETKTETIPATGNHTWGVGVETTPATETTDGVMTYTCTVCGATKTETIPATGGDEGGDEGGETPGGDEGGETPGGDENPNEPDVPETEITTEDDLIEALAEGGEIELAADITASSSFTVSADTTLDLAGNTLSSSTAEVITVEAGATLTVKDSSSGDDEGGSIAYSYVGEANAAGAAWNTSTNYGEAVKVEEGGSLVLESGTISSSSVGIRAEAVTSSSESKVTITIEGGSIESEYYTIWASGDVDITVSGGTIAGTSKGLFIAGDDKFGYGEVQSGTTTLNVQGGTISCEKDSAICTIGNTTSDHKVVNISGGTITGPDLYDEETQNATPMPAIYNASGNLTITGGTITGSTAVEHRGGELTISGGTLTSSYKGAQNTPAYAKSGATGYGYALVIYPFDHGSYPWNKTMVVAISGGTFTGDIYVADNVLNGDDQDETITASISISGITITGEIKVAVATESMLEWAVALDNATVTLGSNIETDSLSTIYVHGTITLDLNGFTMKQTASGSNGWGLICVEDGGNLTIEDTSTEGTGAIEVAAYYAITVKGSPNASKTYLTVESGTIKCWGYVISTNGSGAASDGVGSYGNVEITLNGGTYVSTANEAIYIPVGTFKITNSTIVGTTGIEIRGGSLTISNSTVVGTGEADVDWEGNINNGAISSGYAIANTHTSSYYTVTVTLGENVNICGLIYMKNTEDSTSVLADTDTTWGNYDRVIGERGNSDSLYWMGDVEFAESKATATLSDDGYTYVISGTSASMTDDQLKAYWVLGDGDTHDATDYIAIAVVAGVGETVTITTHNGDVYTTNGGTTGKAKPFVINVTDYVEDTSEFFMNVVVTDSDGNLKAAYVITLGEITSAAKETP